MKWTANALYKSCFNKSKFKTFDRAYKRAKKYNQRVYFCPICGKYHLTSDLDAEKYKQS